MPSTTENLNSNSRDAIRPTDQQPDSHQALGLNPPLQPLPISTGMSVPELPADISILDHPQANLHWLLQVYRNQFINGEQSVTGSGCSVSTPRPLLSTPLPSTPPRPPLTPPVEDSPGGLISGPADMPLQQASEDDNPFSSPTGSPNASSQKRVRVSSTNAVYDFVTGAMRGNKALSVARTAPLRPACETVSQATRRFNREIPQILSRCERLSEETGCWLILAAQHANGASAATHYTSTRLRREARKETVDILNSFQTLTSCLLTSKREEALHLAQKLAAVEEAQAQALQAKDAELAERDELILRYEERLKSLGV